MAQISIIITAYNVQDYIATAISSALNQQDVSVEIIVIVDGGTDNTAKIVNSFKTAHPEMKILVKENGGVSSARNAGLKLATSDYVMFLDGDDQLLPNACKDFLAVAYTEDADIVVSDYFSENEGIATKTLKKASDFSPMIGSDFAISILTPRSTVSVWNKCYKRHLFDEVQFPANISMGEDLLTLFDVSLKAKLVAPLAKPTLIYLIRSFSLVNSSSEHLLSIIVVMQMLKTRLIECVADKELALDIYSVNAFYHVMYSRVVRDERFGTVHSKMHDWFVSEICEYEGRTKVFIQSLPWKERFLINCYRRSYTLTTWLLRIKAKQRIVLSTVNLT